MTPLAGQPVRTIAETRTAEADAVACGRTVESLMAQAGAGIATWTARLGGGAPVLIVCGPGNNGDGYVAARVLREGGLPVRVVAHGEPVGAAAIMAARDWASPVEALADAAPAPVVVDALYGTGARALDRVTAGRLAEVLRRARLSIAVDVPSGADADARRSGGWAHPVDVTLALGTLKPVHFLQPGAEACGTVRLVELGLAGHGAAAVIDRPALVPPGPSSHKYSRGLVVVVGGAMPGAARLAATAAMRVGAGYVTMLDGDGAGLAAIVQRRFDAAAFDDPRIGAVVIGPGLGRDDNARARLAAALATDRPLVIDGDALRLIDLDRLAARAAPAILTPHAGEFDHLFGAGEGSKLDRTRAAAVRARAIVVHKGPDTVVAAPDGRAALAEPGSPWLSTAGTGDVLAGTAGAMLAALPDPFAAAQAAVWLHAAAARRLGAAFVADDLAAALGAVRATL